MSLYLDSILSCCGLRGASGWSVNPDYAKKNIEHMVGTNKHHAYGATIAVLNTGQRIVNHDAIIESGGRILLEFPNPVHNGNLLTLYVWEHAAYTDDKDTPHKYRYSTDRLKNELRLAGVKPETPKPVEVAPVPPPNPAPVKKPRARRKKALEVEF